MPEPCRPRNSRYYRAVVFRSGFGEGEDDDGSRCESVDAAAAAARDGDDADGGDAEL